MNNIELAEQEIKGLEEQIIKICDYWHAQTKGKIVVLRVGKYKGRSARISACIPCHKYGLLFCCMVLRKNSLESLNSDCATRSFHPRKDFDLSP